MILTYTSAFPSGDVIVANPELPGLMRRFGIDILNRNRGHGLWRPYIRGKALTPIPPGYPAWHHAGLMHLSSLLYMAYG